MWNRVWMRRLLSIGMDATVCVLAIFVSLVLRFEPEGALPKEVWVRVWTGAPWIVGLHVLILWAGGTYRVLWRLADAEEIMRLLLLGVAACALSLILNGLLRWQIPRSVLALTSTLTILACTGL
ncbi:MAG TPA: hypothetical protein PKE04_22655, partial [Clostridia bacterium]|nr:hypothetical protein [Clostridia bacterium]